MTSSSRASVMSGKPCYKCGKTGHWARDCTAPRELQLSKEDADALRANGTMTTTRDGNGDVDGVRDDGENGAAAATAATPGSGMKKRASGATTTRKPKFSVHEHLLGPNGLVAIYTTFPERYAKNRKGEGHELHDAELLISMYKEWAVKMYPFAPAERTLERVQKLSKDKAVQMTIREFEERDFGGGVGDAVEAMDRAEAAAKAGEENAEDGEDVFFPDDDEDDDDEKMANAKEDEDLDFPDDYEEEDYEFGDDDEDMDAARAMQEADEDAEAGAASESESDDEEEDTKRGKKVKGATDSTKAAFARLAAKLGKTVDADPPGESDVLNETTVNSPQRKVLRVKQKGGTTESDDEDEENEPEEPTRRRRAVQLEDEDDE